MKPLFCPLLQMMRNHALNNNTKVNLAVVCIHGLVSCLGILENALIIWVVGFRLRRRTVASVWVLNLAMSDFLATLTLPLFTSYLNSPHSWELGNPLCKAQASIFFLNMFVSAFLLAAISLDRLLLATKPVWSQNHRSVAGAWKVCAVGWLWAGMNTLPYFLFRSVTEKKDGRKLCYHNFALYLSSEDTLERDCNVRQGTTAISKLVLAFLLPLVVVVGSYVKIGISLKNRDRRRKQNGVAGIPKTTKTFFLKPLNTGPPLTLEESLKLVEVGLPLATTFAFLNPLLNPILYAFSCPHFCVRIRQSLGAVFDGLVEEGGGLLMAPGRSLRAHMRQKSSKDVSFTMPGSPKSPHSQSADIQPPFPPHFPTEGLKDSHVEYPGQESKSEVEPS
uniref:Prostaglandin D2 receptor 2 n=1 Tax=Amphiprion percula TaxID=161767 RepID=A0A3P8TF04_AMPPE